MNRFIHILPILFSIYFIPLKGQNSKTDSLFRILNRNPVNDTNRIKILNAIAESFVKSNPDTAIYFSSQAKNLSEKLLFAEGKAEALLWMGTVSSVSMDHHLAIEYLTEGISLTTNNRRKAMLHNQLGSIYRSEGHFPAALKNFTKALKLLSKNSDEKLIGNIYSNLGLTHYNMGNYSEALNYHFASLKIREKEKDPYGIAASYGNLGLVYTAENMLEDALRYYASAIEKFKQLNNKNAIASTLNNISHTYVKLKRFDDALDTQMEAIKIREEMGDKIGISGNYNNMGMIYAEQANYTEALKYFTSALKIKQESGDAFGEANCYNNIGKVYVLLNKIDEGRRWLKKGLALAKETGSKEIIKLSYEGLNDVESKAGNYKSALEYFQLYTAYRDSMVNEENTKRSVQQQMQYEFEKRQSTDSIRNAELAKVEALRHHQELQQQKTFTYGGIGGFILMLAVAGISFRAYKQKKKDNKIIEQQKHLVEVKQKEILDSIKYARRIQQSLMPNDKQINRSLGRLKK